MRWSDVMSSMALAMVATLHANVPAVAQVSSLRVISREAQTPGHPDAIGGQGSNALKRRKRENALGESRAVRRRKESPGRRETRTCCSATTPFDGRLLFRAPWCQYRGSLQKSLKALRNFKQGMKMGRKGGTEVRGMEREGTRGVTPAD